MAEAHALEKGDPPRIVDPVDAQMPVVDLLEENEARALTRGGIERERGVSSTARYEGGPSGATSMRLSSRISALGGRQTRLLLPRSPAAVQLGELVNCVGRKVIWFDVPAEVHGDPDLL
jgi:hypothetical protein